MAEVKVNVKVEQLSPKVLEVRTVIRGQYFSRRYFGYSPENALVSFEQWLNKQNIK